MFNDEDIKLINQGSVDSRAKETAGNPLKTHSLYALERVYCIYCGTPHGYVSQDSSKYIKAMNVVFVCDPCIIERGAPPLQEAKIPEVLSGNPTRNKA